VTGDDGKVIAWPAGKPFADRVRVVKGLDGGVFDIVSDELVAHLNALQAEKEKNETADGGTESKSSSPSAS
jgi:hypothetical protein